MAKKRILFLSPSMRSGGAERVIRNIIKYIDKEHFFPMLGLLKREGRILKELPHGLEISELGAGRVRYSLGKLVALIHEKRPDIIFSILGQLNLTTMFVRPLISRKVKFIARETNIPSKNISQSNFPGLFPVLYRVLYPRFDKVICQSSDMMYDLAVNFGVPLEKAVVINNPVDILDICRRAHYNGKVFSKGRFNILAAGKLKYQKGFDLLLKSMSCLNTDKFHLTLLGQGPEEGNLKRLAHDLQVAKQVTFVGAVDNPYPYMKQADMFALSSRFEGFPNVVLESMSLGKPVVAFECPGGINEIIKDGINGWKIDVGDTEAFAKALQKAEHTQWNSKVIKGQIERRYSIEKIVSQYEKLFMDTIKS